MFIMGWKIVLGVLIGVSPSLSLKSETDYTGLWTRLHYRNILIAFEENSFRSNSRPTRSRVQPDEAFNSTGPCLIRY
jgi:hypothetical protein